jgi:DNA-binding NarL/FixJ family response regulator
LNDCLGWPQTEVSLSAQVEMREIIRLLPHYLTPGERDVLKYLAQGLGTHEIALRVKLSDPTVAKYRRRIAAIATRLELGR